MPRTLFTFADCNVTLEMNLAGLWKSEHGVQCCVGRSNFLVIFELRDDSWVHRASENYKIHMDLISCMQFCSLIN
jgi:hypothetical protein